MMLMVLAQEQISPTLKRDRARQSRSTRLAPVVALGVMVILVALYYRSALAISKFGFYNDDAIYLTTAKALATGQGYRIISVPYAPAQTKYPPLFPFLLSIVWRLKPDFPGNVNAMMLVTVFSSLAASAAAWFYLTKCKYASAWTALAAVGLAAINVKTLTFSTLLLSDMTFAALTSLALLLAEIYDGKERGLKSGALAGIAMGLAFLTRANGIAVIVAIGLYFILAGRWKKALLPVGIAGLFVAGWVSWAHLNRTGHVETNSVYLTNYYQHYFNELRDAAGWHDCSLASEACSAVVTNARDLSMTVAQQTLGLYNRPSGETLIGVKDPATRALFVLILILIAVGLGRHIRPRLRLLPVFLITFLAFLLPLPPQESSYDRYAVPLLPFFLALLLSCILWAAKRLWAGLGARPGPALKVCSRFMILPLVGIFAFTLFAYGISAYTSVKNANTVRHEGIVRFRVEAEGFNWIKANTPSSAIVASIYHSMYYLYTGRKSVLCFPTENPYPPSDQSALRRILDESGATYLALDQNDIDNEIGGLDYESQIDELEDDGLIEQVYKSDDGLMNVYHYTRNEPDAGASNGDDADRTDGGTKGTVR